MECRQANALQATIGQSISTSRQLDRRTSVVTKPFKLENIILQESYVLDISRTEKQVSFVMEFLLENGQTPLGRLVFPDVESEEWLTPNGDSESLNHLITFAHRYYGGPDERPDLGTINAIRFEDGRWEVLGDWGSCRLRSPATPRVVTDEDSLVVSAPLT
jgi:hypothetical protein